MGELTSIWCCLCRSTLPIPSSGVYVEPKPTYLAPGEQNAQEKFLRHAYRLERVWSHVNDAKNGEDVPGKWGTKKGDVLLPDPPETCRINSLESINRVEQVSGTRDASKTQSVLIRTEAKDTREQVTSRPVESSSASESTLQ
jgi:hypothetical protein